VQQCHKQGTAQTRYVYVTRCDATLAMYFDKYLTCELSIYSFLREQHSKPAASLHIFFVFLPFRCSFRPRALLNYNAVDHAHIYKACCTLRVACPAAAARFPLHQLTVPTLSHSSPHQLSATAYVCLFHVLSSDKSNPPPGVCLSAVAIAVTGEAQELAPFHQKRHSNYAGFVKVCCTSLAARCA
jgi:hypothetical protein